MVKRGHVVGNLHHIVERYARSLVQFAEQEV
jgi:hypothetical protein